MLRFTSGLAALLISATASAQIDVDIDLGQPEWYENPYLWVGVVVLLIIVLLVTRRRAS